jgi:glycosyltransferase involved in cell wall biosynthesis
MAQMEPLTIAIPSYQRSGALRRLLESIRVQLDADAELCDDLDVLVVLDGSTDGSRAMLERVGMPVPLRSCWQENQGLAGARNTLLRESTSPLIWFLDDDMILADGCVRRHRTGSRMGVRSLRMGPCQFPPAADIVGLTRTWADDVYEELKRAGSVTDPQHVSIANTSGPTDLFRELGGFDARFRGWGGEDVEFGIRALAAGVDIVFDAEAIAWHHQERGIVQMLKTKIDEGRNCVVIAELHPDTASWILPQPPGNRSRLLYSLVARIGPVWGVRVARLTAWLALLEHRLAPWRRRPIFDAAVRLSTYAGMAQQDPDGTFRRQLAERTDG